VLDWRQLTKLRSTYTDALPNTSIRRPPRAHHLRAGRDDDRAAVIHRAEPAEHSGAHRGWPQDPQGLHRHAKGHKLVSADYSQIELRVLAHVADIPH
jgi:DNA polymerase-1